MKFGFLVVMMAVLSGCTFGVPIGGYPENAPSSGSSSKSKSGNPASYVVFGKRYYVLDSADGYAEKGIASWYGPDFHGKRTSSGEVYNMHAMTAAHKTLPIPVRVKVTNLNNGKSVIVKVNDRGPFSKGRIIDLSFAAAKKLDVVGPGTAPVEVVALTGQSTKRSVVRTIPLQSESAFGGDIYIQLGAFSSEINAINLRNDLENKNEKPIKISRVGSDTGELYRVVLGPLLDVSEADSVQKRLMRKGYSKTRIIID